MCRLSGVLKKGLLPYNQGRNSGCTGRSEICQVGPKISLITRYRKVEVH